MCANLHKMLQMCIRKTGVSLVLLLIMVLQSYSQPTITVGLKAKRLAKVLESIHYQPATIDTAASRQIIEEMMKKLDPKSIYFLKEDESILLKYSDSLLIDIECYSDKLIETTTTIYSRRLNQSDSIITELLKTPFNYQKNEVLDSKTDGSITFCDGKDDFVKNWQKILKARILSELYIQEQDSFHQKLSLIDTLKNKELELVKRVEIISKQRIKKIFDYPEGFDEYIHSAFLNSITSVYDPHTNYFSNDKKQEFEESLSRNITGFGISYFNNHDGNIEIDGITFGSPAWFSDSLENGDIIISVQPMGQNTIDLTYHDSEDLNEIIGSTSNTTIVFTVRKPNNQIIVKQLIKSKIESENYARSFVLKGNKTVGYIYLPSFYTSFEMSNRTGCALDILKEVAKLMSENIEGLIIDLRQNGGGAVNEAADIASIFIEEGNFAKLSTRDLGNQFLTRTTPGITYNKPLLVLVDQTTASASELLAGTLKIYNRAVIVGANTFGKFTGQLILPLNREMSNANRFTAENKTGFVKVTTERTYLADGISYQAVGIKPNIELPCLFNSIDYREAGLEHSFKSDTIDKDDNFKPLQELPLALLLEKSKNRVSENEYFNNIIKLENEFNSLHYMYERMNLQIDSFQTDLQRFNQFLTQAKKREEYKVANFNVANNNFDLSIPYNDDNKKKINEKIIKVISSDAYIEESFLILCDLIDLTKQKSEGVE